MRCRASASAGHAGAVLRLGRPHPDPRKPRIRARRASATARSRLTGGTSEPSGGRRLRRPAWAPVYFGAGAAWIARTRLIVAVVLGDWDCGRPLRGIGAACRRGGRRRSHPAAGAGTGEPRGVDPRVGRAAPRVAGSRVRRWHAVGLRHLLADPLDPRGGQPTSAAYGTDWRPRADHPAALSGHSPPRDRHDAIAARPDRFHAWRGRRASGNEASQASCCAWRPASVSCHRPFALSCRTAGSRVCWRPRTCCASCRHMRVAAPERRGPILRPGR
jgi:hypothetical protein